MKTSPEPFQFSARACNPSAAAGLEPVMQLLLAWRNTTGGEPWHPDQPAMKTEGTRKLAGGDSPAAFQQPHEAIYRLMGVPLP